MSDRILAMGIADSVIRVTPVSRQRRVPRRVRIGAIASMVGWFALAATVLTILRAFAQ